MEGMSEKEKRSVQTYFIRMVHRYSSLNYKKFMEFGVHPGQFPVIKMIHLREGITQREIARELHVKPPTVTVTVKRLEKAGLVERKSDKADLRVSRLYLTDRGQEIARKMKDLLMENEQILTRGFSDQETDLLRSYFQRMIDNLEQAQQRGELPSYCEEMCDPAEEPEAACECAEKCERAEPSLNAEKNRNFPE